MLHEGITHGEISTSKDKKKIYSFLQKVIREEGTEEKKNISKVISEKSKFQKIKNLLEIHSVAFEIGDIYTSLKTKDIVMNSISMQWMHLQSLIDILRNLLSDKKKLMECINSKATTNNILWLLQN